MAARSDNSRLRNSSGSLPRTGEGVVIDIGTGDGRFVSASAKANPNKFFIGIDANTKPLEKPSMRATRKPAKGGLPNALFVRSAVEDLPEELNSVADEIHIHFPWGSLLQAVATGDTDVLTSLRRIAAPDCLLEVVIGLDPVRDRAEMLRLRLPELDDTYIKASLLPRYQAVGFTSVEHGVLDAPQWSKLETSWAKKLSGNEDRGVRYLVFRAA